VRDDGVGGARPDGSGLLGLADRVAALGGQLQVEGPADGGTFVVAAIPLEGGRSTSDELRPASDRRSRGSRRARRAGGRS